MPAAGRIAVVTGPNGFVARNLIARLRRDGWTVYGVSRDGTAPAGVTGIRWEDFWAAGELKLSSVKAVFHLAAFIPPDFEDSGFAGQCLEVNALLTLRLAEFMARQGQARFIHCSSGQAYRFQEGPADEGTPVDPLLRACFYLTSKLLGETYVERTRLRLGLDAVSFRVASCYGPWMSARALVARFSELAAKGEPLPLLHGGAEQFDLVHVDDVVELLARAATATAQGIFNAGSGQAVRVRAVAETVNDVFGNRAGTQDLPARSSAAPPPGFAPLCMARASATFGIRPRTLREGVAQHRDWLREHAA